MKICIISVKKCGDSLMSTEFRQPNHLLNVILIVYVSINVCEESMATLDVRWIAALTDDATDFLVLVHDADGRLSWLFSISQV